MSRLIGVILMVFALTFGMTLVGCGNDEPETPTIEDVEKKVEEAKKEGEGSAEKVIEKGEEAAKEVEKKAD